MAKTADIIIVGGGILGTSLAYHLCTRGAGRVLLLEKGPLASGSTGKSAAIVRMHYTNRATVNLALRSRELFLQWTDRVGGPDMYHQTGWYFLTGPDQAEHVRANLAMNQSLGVDAELVGTDDLERHGWGMNLDDLGLVVHEAKSGWADPVQTCTGLAAFASQHGVEIQLNSPVSRLRSSGDRVTGVQVGTQSYEADQIVLAAGPWSGKLASTVGLELPLEIYREQEVMFQPQHAAGAPDCPISNMCEQVYCRPKGDGRLLVGRGFPKQYETVEPDDYAVEHDAGFVQDVRQRLTRRFPAVGNMSVTGGVVGLYTVTPDWHPIVGSVAAKPGLWLATGGSGHSFKIGPATGQMLADLMTNGSCDWVDAELFGLERFESGRTFGSTYGGNRA